MKRSNSLADKAWSSVSEIHSGQEALRWCRLVARSGHLFIGSMSSPEKSFTKSLESLHPQDRKHLAVLLTYAKNHYQNQSDNIGVIGIPVFLALFAFIEFTEIGTFAALFFCCAIMFYVALYSYHRFLLAIATTATESFQFVVVELDRNSH